MHNNKVRRLVSMFYSGPVIFVNEDSLSLDKYSVDKHPEYRYVFKSGYIAATSMDPTANYHSPFSVHDTPTTRLVFMLNDRETGKSYDTFSMYAIRSQIKRHMKRLELARLKEN